MKTIEIIGLFLMGAVAAFMFTYHRIRKYILNRRRFNGNVEYKTIDEIKAMCGDVVSDEDLKAIAEGWKGFPGYKPTIIDPLDNPAARKFYSDLVNEGKEMPSFGIGPDIFLDGTEAEIAVDDIVFHIDNSKQTMRVTHIKKDKVICSYYDNENNHHWGVWFYKKDLRKVSGPADSGNK
jgi:hypothetical protein